MEENTQEEVQAVPARKTLVNKIIKIDLDSPGYHNNGIDKLNVEVLNTVNQDTLSELVTDLAEKIYTPTAKDKLYFYSDCVVPRFKVREMWKPKKVAITVKEEYGTHLFLSAKYNKYINTNGYYYKCDAEEFKKFIDINEAIFDAYLPSFKWENIDQRVKDIIIPGNTIHMSWQVSRILYGSSSTMNGRDSAGNDYNFPVANNNTECSPSNVYAFKEDKVAQAFEEAYNDPTNYYLDDAVNRALQDASTTIDSDMYDQLCNLLESTDEDNHTMAMEVMANSNIEKSAKFIYKLMRKYSNKMVYNNGYNSVNFRALRDSTGLDRYTRYDDDSYIRFIQKYDQADMDLVASIREVCKKHAITALEGLYSGSIEDNILEVDIPYIKVVLKGVNDGTQIRKVADPMIVAETTMDAIEHPEHYIEVIEEVPLTPPCAAHDEASVEALKEEVVQEEVEELDQEDREMMDMANDYLNDITDGEYSEEEVAEEFKDAIPTEEVIEAFKDKLKADNPEVIPGTLDALEEISIVADVVEAITPEPEDHNDDDGENVFAEGEFVDDPFSDNLTEADDADLIP